jgi:hypothetical protein
MWPRRKRKKPSPAQVDALRAKVNAELQFRQAQKQHYEALGLVRTLREIREENHFGAALESLNWSKR